MATTVPISTFTAWCDDALGSTLERTYLDAEEDDAFADRWSHNLPEAALNRIVALWRGDITDISVDAIQNAARPSLLGGGGIDGAIHRAAGPELRAECALLGGCSHGEAKVTSGHGLHAKHVIHTVGPNRDLHTDDECPALLEASYRNSFEAALSVGVRSLALCCVSVGAYRVPLRPATHVALSTVRAFLTANPDSLDRVIFVVFTKEEEQVYRQLMPRHFPRPQDVVEDK
mmetsp:Transcript_49880/g.117263  ORF Transcript_49880/g.117263 Transcript_49880/m.117263 type:complete len:231 (+) Transcript_49880:77-769(+)